MNMANVKLADKLMAGSTLMLDFYRSRTIQSNPDEGTCKAMLPFGTLN